MASWEEFISSWSPRHQRAVVLLSGGLDSVTVLALAERAGLQIHAISFDYRQRHRVELKAAKAAAARYAVAEHLVVPIDFSFVGVNPLLGSSPVPAALSGDEVEGKPLTYIPARNIMFFAHAIGLAEVRGATLLLFGADATDWGGYPDCRPEFIDAIQQVANCGTWAGSLGRDRQIEVEAPLVDTHRKEVVSLARLLGVSIEETWSCYDPQLGSVPCGICDACVFRSVALEEAG